MLDVSGSSIIVFLESYRLMLLMKSVIFAWLTFINTLPAEDWRRVVRELLVVTLVLPDLLHVWHTNLWSSTVVCSLSNLNFSDFWTFFSLPQQLHVFFTLSIMPGLSSKQSWDEYKLGRKFRPDSETVESKQTGYLHLGLLLCSIKLSRTFYPGSDDQYLWPVVFLRQWIPPPLNDTVALEA